VQAGHPTGSVVPIMADKYINIKEELNASDIANIRLLKAATHTPGNCSDVFLGSHAGYEVILNSPYDADDFDTELSITMSIQHENVSPDLRNRGIRSFGVANHNHSHNHSCTITRNNGFFVWYRLLYTET